MNLQSSLKWTGRWRLFLLALVTVGSLGGGAVLSRSLHAGDGDPSEKDIQGDKKDRYESLGLFNKVLYFVEQNYVENVKEKDLILGAIRGMLETLDPHSHFLTGESYREMKIDTSGKFGGVGLEVSMKDGVLTVVSPIDDTPAFRAGIKAGDRIVRINGQSTKGMNVVEAMTAMRGNRGSEVKVSVWRPGLDKPKEFSLRREEIKIQAVKAEELETGYLYLRLSNFNESSGKDLKKAMDQYESRKKKGLSGVVLDLRNNPGGLLDQAVEVVSLFLDEGIVVSTRGRTKESEDIKYAKKGFARKQMPVGVLVNQASASASEIVAGALQDHKRAVIMGQNTFGKGSVQSVVEVAPDMGLKLTIARYYTPSGHSIQATGIRPDILIEEYEPKLLEQARKKREYLHEKDLTRRMKSEKELAKGEGRGEESDFSLSELEELDSNPSGVVGSSGDSRSPNQTSASGSAHDEEDAKPIPPKQDYQVRQALNYLKSFKVLTALKVEAPSSQSVAEGDKKRSP